MLGVAKPCVVKHVCTSINKKNALYHVFLGVKCNKTPLLARICSVSSNMHANAKYVNK